MQVRNIDNLVTAANIGDIVYFEDSHQMPYCGELAAIDNVDNNGIVRQIARIKPVSNEQRWENGVTCQSMYSNYARPVDQVFKTYTELLVAQEKRADRLVEHYRSQMTNLEEILRFALETPVAPCEEYSNEEAVIAFKRAAREVLGISLD